LDAAVAFWEHDSTGGHGFLRIEGVEGAAFVRGLVGGSDTLLADDAVEGGERKGGFVVVEEEDDVDIGASSVGRGWLGASVVVIVAVQKDNAIGGTVW